MEEKSGGGGRDARDHKLASFKAGAILTRREDQGNPTLRARRRRKEQGGIRKESGSVGGEGEERTQCFPCRGGGTPKEARRSKSIGFFILKSEKELDP